MSSPPEAPNLPHVAYVALGTARGHLMSAAVVRTLLLLHSYAVSVYTTSRDGKVFFEEITGYVPNLLSNKFNFTYDDAHNLLIRHSTLRVARYLLSKQLRNDITYIRNTVADGTTIINDIHPAPMLVQRWYERSHHISLINVLSEHSLGAVEQLGAGWLPGSAGRLGRAKIRRVFMKCSHAIINTLDPARFFLTEGNITFLPPIVEPARAPTAQVREHLGVRDGQRLFVVYMNPIFRQKELLAYLVDLASHFGAFLYVVSESFVMPGLTQSLKNVRIAPYDFHLGEKIRAADLLITAAGIAAPIQSYAYGVPLVVLVTAQPEHQRNAQTIVDAGMGKSFRNAESLLEAATTALEGERQPHAEIIERTRERWLSIIASAGSQRQKIWNLSVTS